MQDAGPAAPRARACRLCLCVIRTLLGILTLCSTHAGAGPGQRVGVGAHLWHPLCLVHGVVLLPLLLPAQALLHRSPVLPPPCGPRGCAMSRSCTALLSSSMLTVLLRAPCSVLLPLLCGCAPVRQASEGVHWLASQDLHLLRLCSVRPHSPACDCCVVPAVCQGLRILSFTVTQLPGPNYHCRGGTSTAVRAWPTHWWEHVTLDLGRQVLHPEPV